MNKFRAKSNIVLGVLSVLSLLAFIAVENNKVNIKQEWYDEKYEAALLSKRAAEFLKNFRLVNGVFIDAVNDPNKTALIGQEYTLITTDRGDIESKLLSSNPNFAALIVQMLKEAGVNKNDNVAVAMTGSFPALNISVIAAIQTLKANPIIITSVGASNWGANDPYFTWLDMENELYKAEIFHHKSVAASIGGGNDIGRGLSPEGRNLIIEAIKRNGLTLINEPHLEKSIDKRMEIYKKLSKNKSIKAFINVGGGIASLGNPINGRIIPSGLSHFIPNKNFPVNGIMIQMGQQRIPVIHLLNIKQLAANHGLSTIPTIKPEPGKGEIFVKEKYSMVILIISTSILVSFILLIYFADKKYYKIGAQVVSTSIDSKNGNENDELI